MAYVDMHSVSYYTTYPHHYPKITHDLSPENHNAIDTTNEDDLLLNEQDTHLNNYDQWKLSKINTTKITPENEVGSSSNLCNVSYSLKSFLSKKTQNYSNNRYDINSYCDKSQLYSKDGGIRIEDVEKIENDVPETSATRDSTNGGYSGTRNQLSDCSSNLEPRGSSEQGTSKEVHQRSMQPQPTPRRRRPRKLPEIPTQNKSSPHFNFMRPQSPKSTQPTVHRQLPQSSNACQSNDSPPALMTSETKRAHRLSSQSSTGSESSLAQELLAVSSTSSTSQSSSPQLSSLAQELCAADPSLLQNIPASIDDPMMRSCDFLDMPRSTISFEDLGSPDDIESPGIQEIFARAMVTSQEMHRSQTAPVLLCEDNPIAKEISFRSYTLQKENSLDLELRRKDIAQSDNLCEDLQKTPTNEYEEIGHKANEEDNNSGVKHHHESISNKSIENVDICALPCNEGLHDTQGIYIDDEPNVPDILPKDINSNMTKHPNTDHQKVCLHEKGVQTFDPVESMSSQSNEIVTKPATSSPDSELTDYDDMDATHRGCHRFVPRHSDELFIEIGDPIHVFMEEEDLWCEGLNLRTGKRGIFPSAHATDLSFLEDDPDRPMRFILRFLGSVEVSQNKGIDVLCQAIHKVAFTRRKTPNAQAPPLCSLEINEYGIKMIDKSKKAKKSANGKSVKNRLERILSKDKCASEEDTHFFSLKNISFCGYHPRNDKYFAFITKHPVNMRFACHVFLAETSAIKVSDTVQEAFRKFYQQYLAFVHPTEDIYIE